MYLALRQGNGPVLIPDRYRRQYAGRGWTLKSAPAEYAPVALPTPLAQASRVAIAKEEPSAEAETVGGSSASSKPKRKRRTRKPKAET